MAAGDIVLVTGGASGLGAATCARLAGNGAAVIVADLDQAKGEAVARAMPGDRAA